MKWIELSLQQTQQIERQCDEVCSTLEMLTAQQQAKQRSPNHAQIAKAIDMLTKAIAERMQQMNAFYGENDLDPRAQKIEQCRLKLKKYWLAATSNGSAFAGGPTGANSAQSHRAPQQPSATLQSPPTVLPTSTFETPVPVSLPQSQHRSGNTSTSATPHAYQRLPDAPAIETNNISASQILVRVVMTAAEFEELQLRRAAMKQFLLGSRRPSGAAGPNRGT